MILIVAHHYVVNSGVYEILEQNPFSGLNSVFLLLFGAWGKTGINCFVLITGYFMCKSKITLKKFLKLLFEVELYKIIIYIIFLFTGKHDFSVTGLAKAILPVTSVGTAFTSAYLLFYLFIPFLNILINNMDRKQHLYLILLSVFVYVILGTIPKIDVIMNYVSWFIVLYFISSFLRIYPFKFSDSKLLWGMFLIVSVIVSVISVILCAWLGTKIGLQSPYYLLSDSNKVLAVITAVCAFMFFKNLHFYCKFINVVASACFGVLCIHANSDSMRSWLWGDLLNVVSNYTSPFLILHAIGAVLGVYVICTVIDIIRIYLIEKPLFRFLGKKFKKTFGE